MSLHIPTPEEIRDGIMELSGEYAARDFDVMLANALDIHGKNEYLRGYEDGYAKAYEEEE